MDNQVGNNLILKDLFLNVLLTNGYSEEVTKNLMEQKADTENKLKEVEAEMDDVKDNIQANLEAAEVFNEPAAQVLIPYERDYKVSDTAINTMMRIPWWQLPYTRSTVMKGQYRIWIEQLTEDQITSFQKICSEGLAKELEKKITAPEWKSMERELTRNFMYEVELHRRRFGWDKTVKEKLFTDYQAEVTLWQARYQTKRETYFEIQNVIAESKDEASMPY